MNKEQLRKDYRTKRNLLSNTDIKRLSLEISNQLKSNFIFKNKLIHTFLSIESLKEIDTKIINDFLFLTNCKIATSITQFKPFLLNHSLISSTTKYQLDKYQIPIPINKTPINIDDIDIVLIPLLAFDKNGNRLGYGKGLYDSFLKDCKTECLKIGLSFFEAHHELIDSESHDIKLDYCITPNNIYNFSI